METDSNKSFERMAQTVPRISPHQMNIVRRFGEEIQVPAGQVLYSRGERNVDFYVVVNGSIEVFETDACGKERVLTLLEDSQFTGELHLFNDRQILVSGRTRRNSSLLRVHRCAFRRMLNAEPDLAEMMMQAFILRRAAFVHHSQAGVLVIGSPRNPDTQRIRQFLVRNYYPHKVIDPTTEPNAMPILSCFSLSINDLPAVVDAKDKAMKNPDTSVLAEALGLLPRLSKEHVYDIIIAGAGPAGLAAAVYAASEGLDTLVLDPLGPGGQAGTSSRIENYLGFPNGISGQDLAGRAEIQAEKFGAQLAVAREVVHAKQTASGNFELTLCDGSQVLTRSVVVASGARYRKLTIAGYERFEGRGIHYAATAMEAQLCSHEIVIVGGGNSAGQAAVYLSGNEDISHVHMLVRSRSLAVSMSSYLVERIQASSKITLHFDSEIIHLDGSEGLEQVQWQDRIKNEVVTRPIRNLFVMIGAEPNTSWLKGCMPLDPKGFVLTGKDSDGRALESPYATVHPRIFAIGDARAESVKRVAAAVGEGSVVVESVHRSLEKLREKEKALAKSSQLRKAS
jgi:thioredoxin reductase (NADPH)